LTAKKKKRRKIKQWIPKIIKSERNGALQAGRYKWREHDSDVQVLACSLDTNGAAVGLGL